MPTLASFGAIGDGLTDDTAAIIAAVQSGEPLDWQGRTYLHTGFSAPTDNVFWEGKGARLIHIGGHKKEAVGITCTGRVFANNLTFDGGATAHQGICIFGNGGDVDLHGITSQNVRRINSSIVGGDAILVSGGRERVTMRDVTAKDCIMAPGAVVESKQGIFGITITGKDGAFVRTIDMSGIVIDGVYSEDAACVEDMDGVRIFQNMADRTATCTIRGIVGNRVANRLVKLHSSPDAIVDGFHMSKVSGTIPQSGRITSAVIEAQRAPAIIKNGRVFFDGVYNDEVCRADTIASDGHPTYGGSVVSGISVWVENCPGNEITVAKMVANAGVSNFNLAMSDVSVQGALKRFCHVNIRGTTGVNTVVASNITGEVTDCAFGVGGAWQGRASVVATNIVNRGSPVPAGDGFNATRTLSVSQSEGLL